MPPVRPRCPPTTRSTPPTSITRTTLGTKIIACRQGIMKRVAVAPLLEEHFAPLVFLTVPYTRNTTNTIPRSPVEHSPRIHTNNRVEIHQLPSPSPNIKTSPMVKRSHKFQPPECALPR